MKNAHLVSVLMVAAILLSALPSPSAVRDHDPTTRSTTKTFTTNTSSARTIVTTTGIATTTRQSSSVPTTIETSAHITIEPLVPICVVQVSLVQEDGSTEWIGWTTAPISECQGGTEYFADAVGFTVAVNQSIVNATSSDSP